MTSMLPFIQKLSGYNQGIWVEYLQPEMQKNSYNLNIFDLLVVSA
jgi:hypothetical protein